MARNLSSLGPHKNWITRFLSLLIIFGVLVILVIQFVGFKYEKNIIASVCILIPSIIGLFYAARSQRVIRAGDYGYEPLAKKIDGAGTSTRKKKKTQADLWMAYFDDEDDNAVVVNTTPLNSPPEEPFIIMDEEPEPPKDMIDRFNFVGMLVRPLIDFFNNKNKLIIEEKVRDAKLKQEQENRKAEYRERERAKAQRLAEAKQTAIDAREKDEEKKREINETQQMRHEDRMQQLDMARQKTIAQAQQREQAEAQRLAQVERQHVQEQERRAQAEAQQRAEQERKRAQAEAQQRAEQERKRAQAEAQRLSEQQRRAQEQARIAIEEAQLTKEERQRLAELSVKAARGQLPEEERQQLAELRAQVEAPQLAEQLRAQLRVFERISNMKYPENQSINDAPDQNVTRVRTDAALASGGIITTAIGNGGCLYGSILSDLKMKNIAAPAAFPFNNRFNEEDHSNFRAAIMNYVRNNQHLLDDLKRYYFLDDNANDQGDGNAIMNSWLKKHREVREYADENVIKVIASYLNCPIRVFDEYSGRVYTNTTNIFNDQEIPVMETRDGLDNILRVVRRGIEIEFEDGQVLRQSGEHYEPMP